MKLAVTLAIILQVILQIGGTTSQSPIANSLDTWYNHRTAKIVFFTPETWLVHRKDPPPPSAVDATSNSRTAHESTTNLKTDNALHHSAKFLSRSISIPPSRDIQQHQLESKDFSAIKADGKKQIHLRRPLIPSLSSIFAPTKNQKESWLVNSMPLQNSLIQDGSSHKNAFSIRQRPTAEDRNPVQFKNPSLNSASSNRLIMDFTHDTTGRLGHPINNVLLNHINSDPSLGTTQQEAQSSNNALLNSINSDSTHRKTPNIDASLNNVLFNRLNIGSGHRVKTRQKTDRLIRPTKTGIPVLIPPIGAKIPNVEETPKLSDKWPTTFEIQNKKKRPTKHVRTNTGHDISLTNFISGLPISGNSVRNLFHIPGMDTLMLSVNEGKEINKMNKDDNNEIINHNINNNGINNFKTENENTESHNNKVAVSHRNIITNRNTIDNDTPHITNDMAQSNNTSSNSEINKNSLRRNEKDKSIWPPPITIGKKHTEQNKDGNTIWPPPITISKKDIEQIKEGNTIWSPPITIGKKDIEQNKNGNTFWSPPVTIGKKDTEQNKDGNTIWSPTITISKKDIEQNKDGNSIWPPPITIGKKDTEQNKDGNTIWSPPIMIGKKDTEQNKDSNTIWPPPITIGKKDIEQNKDSNTIWPPPITIGKKDTEQNKDGNTIWPPPITIGKKDTEQNKDSNTIWSLPITIGKKDIEQNKDGNTIWPPPVTIGKKDTEQNKDSNTIRSPPITTGRNDVRQSKTDITFWSPQISLNKKNIEQSQNNNPIKLPPIVIPSLSNDVESMRDVNVKHTPIRKPAAMTGSPDKVFVEHIVPGNQVANVASDSAKFSYNIVKSQEAKNEHLEKELLYIPRSHSTFAPSSISTPPMTSTTTTSTTKTTATTPTTTSITTTTAPTTRIEIPRTTSTPSITTISPLVIPRLEIRHGNNFVNNVRGEPPSKRIWDEIAPSPKQLQEKNHGGDAFVRHLPRKTTSPPNFIVSTEATLRKSVHVLNHQINNFVVKMGNAAPNPSVSTAHRTAQAMEPVINNFRIEKHENEKRTRPDVATLRPVTEVNNSIGDFVLQFGKHGHNNHDKTSNLQEILTSVNNQKSIKSAYNMNTTNVNTQTSEARAINKSEVLELIFKTFPASDTMSGSINFYKKGETVTIFMDDPSTNLTVKSPNLDVKSLMKDWVDKMGEIRQQNFQQRFAQSMMAARPFWNSQNIVPVINGKTNPVSEGQSNGRQLFIPNDNHKLERNSGHEFQHNKVNDNQNVKDEPSLRILRTFDSVTIPKFARDHLAKPSKDIQTELRDAVSGWASALSETKNKASTDNTTEAKSVPNHHLQVQNETIPRLAWLQNSESQKNSDKVSRTLFGHDTGTDKRHHTLRKSAVIPIISVNDKKKLGKQSIGSQNLPSLTSTNEDVSKLLNLDYQEQPSILSDRPSFPGGTFSTGNLPVGETLHPDLSEQFIIGSLDDIPVPRFDRPHLKESSLRIKQLLKQELSQWARNNRE